MLQKVSSCSAIPTVNLIFKIHLYFVLEQNYFFGVLYAMEIDLTTGMVLFKGCSQVLNYKSPDLAGD